MRNLMGSQEVHHKKPVSQETGLLEAVTGLKCRGSFVGLSSA